MIIDKIDVTGISFMKPKNNAPIRSYRNRPKSFKIAFQRMKPEGRLIHFFNPVGNRQNRQNESNTGDMLRIEFTAIIPFMQKLQPLMPNASYHGPTFSFRIV